MIQNRRSSLLRKAKHDKRRSAARRRRRRLAGLEQLEHRVLLAANPWHNHVNPEDVDGDNVVNPLDALVVINELNSGGSRQLGDALTASYIAGSGEGEDDPSLMVDVNGDEFLTPMDVLRVVNYLNEPEGEDPPLASATLRAIEDVTVTATNTPRTEVTSKLPGEKFRVEVRVTDERTDDDPNNPPANPTQAGNQFGVFAAYLDMLWTQQDGSVPFEVPAGSSTLDPGVAAQVGDLGFPISFRNGDYAPLADPPEERSFIYSNGPKGDVAVPGILDDAGAFLLIGAPLGKSPQFLYDATFQVKSFDAVDDSVQVNEEGTIFIDVLGNDDLHHGTKTINIAAPNSNGTPASGTEFLMFGDTGFGSVDPQGDNRSGSIAPFDRIQTDSVTIDIPLDGRDLMLPDQTITAAKGVATVVNGQVRYVANAGESGTDTFTYTVTDKATGGTTGQGNVTVNIISVNDPPTLNDIANVTIAEDSLGQSRLVEGISAGNGETQALTVTATSNNPGLIPNPTVTYTSPNATATLAYTPVPDMPLPPADDSDTATITVNITDNGPDGIAGNNDDESTSKSFTVTVTAENDDPTITAPSGTQEVDENSNDNTIAGIAVGDIDVGTDDLRVSLSVGEGTVSLNGTGGLAFSAGDGTGDADMSFTGSLANVNTAINGLTYTPDTDFSGPDTLNIRVNDLGNNGTGGGGDIMETVPLDVVPTARPKAIDDDLTVLEDDTNGETVTVTSNDRPTVGGSVTVIKINTTSVSPGDPAVSVANGTAKLESNGTDITFTPDPNYSGSTTFTYEVEDTVNSHDPAAEPEGTVSVTVTAVNDEPDFTVSVPNQTITVDEDSGQKTVANWADFDPGATNESAQTATWTVTAADPTLFSQGPEVNSGTLTFTPAEHANGNTTFDVYVTDSGDTGNGGDNQSPTKTFDIEIDAVNDKPSFTASDPEAANEGDGEQTVANWASGFNPGPNESSQVVAEYIVSNVSNSGLFATGKEPTVGTDGTLTYTPAGNDVFGTSTFEAVVKDNGTTANGGVDTSDAQTFTVTVKNVNDAPSFTASNPATVLEDAGAQTVTGWVTNFDPGPNESQNVNAYLVSNVTNSGFFAAEPQVATNGTLTYEVSAGVSGTATFDVAVQDDGTTANGGVDTSQPQNFQITVTGENDNPVNTIGDGPNNDMFDQNGQTTDDNVDLPFNEANNNVLMVTDVDDDDSLRYSLDLGVTRGTLLFGAADTPATTKNLVDMTRTQINNQLATLIFRPEANFTGIVTLTMTSNDGGASGDEPQPVPLGDTDTLEIDVAERNDPPVAYNDNITATEGTSKQFNVFDNNGVDEDSAGPNEDGFQDIDVQVPFGVTIPISGNNPYTIYSGPEGTVNLLDAETGLFEYTAVPDANFNGQFEFEYTIVDDGANPANQTDTATVTVTVTEVNDDPIPDEDLVLIDPNASAGQQFTISVDELLDGDTPGPENESGQSIWVTSVTSQKGAIITLSDNNTPDDPDDDTFTYTVPAGFDHVDTLTYTVRDNGTTNGTVVPATATGMGTVRDVVLSKYSGYVYLDSNGNGTMDTDERGIGGVTVEITGTGLDDQDLRYEDYQDNEGIVRGPSGAPAIVTGPDGKYEFVGVMPGQDDTLTIKQTQIEFYKDGEETAGDQGGDLPANDQIRVNTGILGHQGGATGEDNNFGEAFGGVPAGTPPENEAAVAADNIRTVERLGAGFLLRAYNQNVRDDPFLSSGFLFGKDATGNVTWFVNLDGWDSYRLVEETSPGVFTVEDTTTNATGTLNTNLVAASLDHQGDVYRIYGSPTDFGLPSYSGGGEGESANAFQSTQTAEAEAEAEPLTVVEEETVETVAAAGDASDYASAVDYLLGGLVG